MTERPPQRLSPLTPVVRGFIVLVAAATTVFRDVAQGEIGPAAVMFALVLIGGAVYGLASWLRTTFWIEADELRVDTGVVSRQSRRIRIDRLQGVDIVQPFVARLFGLAELRMDVAGGNAREGSLAYLPLAEAARLKDLLLDRRAELGGAGAARAGVAGPAGATGTGGQSAAILAAAAGGVSQGIGRPTGLGWPELAGVSTGSASGVSTLRQAQGTAGSTSGVSTPSTGSGHRLRQAQGTAGSTSGVRLATGLGWPDGVSTSSTTGGGVSTSSTTGGVSTGSTTGGVSTSSTTGGVSTSSTTGASERVVARIELPMLLKSIAYSGETVVMLVVIVGLLIGFGVAGEWVGIGAILPVVAGFGVSMFRRFSQNYGFTVSETPAGLQVKRGLFDLSRQTIALKRVQGVVVTEPLMWRRFGWARLDVSIAGYGTGVESEAAPPTAVLPVGRRDVVHALARHVLQGLEPTEVELKPVPRRARWFAPIGYRYLGVGTDEQLVVAREGWVGRRTHAVPQARAQSVRLTQGPLQRRLGLADVHLDSPPGPVTARAKHRDATEARRLFDVEVAMTAWARRQLDADAR
ncbi:PH domain-containing protein [Nocardioides pakistanensis]